MPRSPQPIPSWTPVVPAQPEGAAADLAPSIEPLDLAQRLALEDRSAGAPAKRTPLLVVDVRPRRQFARGHLPHSHAIPAGLLVSGEWPEGDLLLVDEGDGEAERVRNALHGAGYHRRILQLTGGFRAWQAAGLPVERTRSAWCWSRWLGGNGTASSGLPDLQELLAPPDLEDLLGHDDRLPELAGLRRA